ncbi:MAG TPA: C40 family peptidase, partial [Flavisolibacter sp.]
MKYSICSVAAAPVRKEPAHRSEMVNQLLFGELMEILEENDEWIRVRSLYDDYEGWLTYHLITTISKEVAEVSQPYVATGITNPITLPDQLINAPMGSVLVGFDEETRLLWDERYKYHGTYRNTSKPADIHQLPKLVQPWINAPYLWGGKTFMGVDCSGFVQTIFKVLGIQLKRDAYQQAEQGKAVENISLAKEGDLGFFHNEKGRVTHVGIILSPGTIIHSSGKV